MSKGSKKKMTQPEVKGSQGTAEVPKENLHRKEIPHRNFMALSWKSIVQALVIAISALWIYSPVFHGDWIWDDTALIADNSIIHDPAGLWIIWFQPGKLIDYQPITMSIEWIEWQLWGTNTFGYHLVSVVLHIANALLVWRLLSKLDLRLAWIGGLIFVIHPLAIESVAWISELKNTLSLLPFLLAICFWIDYEEQGGKRNCFLALGLFLIAMLCKPTMVMFPVVILLYAWWKRGRIGWNDLKASGAFFAVSLAVCLITICFSQNRAAGNEAIPTGNFLLELAFTGLSILFYFSKCFLPIGLLPIYPEWPVNDSLLLQLLPWPIFGGAAYFLWVKRKSWSRQVSLGLGFFLINLAPVVGLIAVRHASMTWSLDHMAYIPMIGLIGIITAGLERLDTYFTGYVRYYGLGFATVLLVLISLESHWYAGVFINGESLWTYTLQYNSNSGRAHNNLGLALASEGQIPEAIQQYQQAVILDPNNAEAHYNLGNKYRETGRMSEAIEQYKQALTIKPDLVQIHLNFGQLLQTLGKTAEAIEQYEQAVHLDPDNAQTHYNLGNNLRQAGRITEAIEQYEQALKHMPDVAETYFNLSLALMQEGHVSDAILECDQAIKINPNDADCYFIRGNLKLFNDDLNSASDDFTKAIQLNPKFAEAYFRQATIMQIQGNLDKSLSDLQEGCKFAPKDPLADYARLSVWLIEVQLKQKVEADRELSTSLNENWNASADDWVSKVARFLLNQITEEDLLNVAGYKTNPNQVLLCEAWYFVGMRHLGLGDKATAIDDFRKCEMTNQQNSMKYKLAQAELKMLSAF